MAKGSGGGGRSSRATPESRVRAAAVGQPDIVREALFGGVSTMRMSLTAKEKGQLSRARRKGILSYQPARGDFGKTLGPSPKTLFG